MTVEPNCSDQSDVSNAEAKAIARDELIYHLTEDLLVLLEDRGMSKAQLAKALGKSRSFVSQVLSGSRNMTLGTLSDICFELQVNPIVSILPNGAKLLKYEEKQNWEAVERTDIKEVSENVVSIFSNTNALEYTSLEKVAGC